jgi:hypothetical protein
LGVVLWGREKKALLHEVMDIALITSAHIPLARAQSLGPTAWETGIWVFSALQERSLVRWRHSSISVPST